MKLLPDQDERDLASMLSRVLAAECPTSAGPRTATAPTACASHRGCGSRWPTPAYSVCCFEEGRRSGGALSDLGVFCVEAGRASVPDGRAQHAAGRTGHRGWARVGARLAALAGGGKHPWHNMFVEPARRRGDHSDAARAARRRRLAAARRGRFRRRRRPGRSPRRVGSRRGRGTVGFVVPLRRRACRSSHWR